MDKTMQEKLSLILPWLPSAGRPEIVDVGTGTGNLAGAVAKMYPHAQVIGIDLSPEMIEIAKTQNNFQNLTFRLVAAHTPFSKESSAAIYSSILHEIYSYSGDSLEAVRSALSVANQSLMKGGRIIIRDFIQPSNGDKVVILVHNKSDMVPENTFQNFAQNFGRKVPFKVIAETADSISYETNLASAYEYIFRKDYHANWDVELNEKYGFWTREEALSLLQGSGFRILKYEELDNAWILANRIEGKVKIIDPATKEDIPIPKYQTIIAAEKK
ncbi:MAG: methyltransferase domain-containing protein [Bdellovibrionota bacterium]